MMARNDRRCRLPKDKTSVVNDMRTLLIVFRKDACVGSFIRNFVNNVGRRVCSVVNREVFRDDHFLACFLDYQWILSNNGVWKRLPYTYSIMIK